jgi:hypothetical protein
MIKLIKIATAAALSTAVAANAETYRYLCKDAGKYDPLTVDTARNLLEWKGHKYNLSNANDPDKDKIVCANAGWHASGNEESFNFCTATKGYADIETGGAVQTECNLKR